MRGVPDDPVETGSGRVRTFGLVAGAVLTVGATAVVFFTEDPRVLRLAVIAGAWGFVLALLAARRRRPSEPVDTVSRRAHADDLARTVSSTRRQVELELESRSRRDAEAGMRAELAALRRDVVALGTLRHELAALGALQQDVTALGTIRQDVAALGALRQELAQLGALRQDVAALSALQRDVAAVQALQQDLSGPGGLRAEIAGVLADVGAMRQDLGQLSGLRSDLGTLRAELTEQLSSELLVERIVMRTQSSRLANGTGEEPLAGPSTSPGTRAIEAFSWSDEPTREGTGGWPAVDLAATSEPAARSWATSEPAARSWEPEPAHQVPARPVPPPSLPPVVRPPAALPVPPPPVAAAPPPPRPAPRPEGPRTVQTPVLPSPGETRLAQILAENAATGQPGGRRRHRYREDDEQDDVLARVLRG